MERAFVFVALLLTFSLVHSQQYQLDATIRSDPKLVENIGEWIEEMKQGSTQAIKNLEGLIDTREFLDSVNYGDELALLQILCEQAPSEYRTFKLGVALAKNERYSEAIIFADQLFTTTTDSYIRVHAQALLTHALMLSGDFQRGSSLLATLNRTLEYPRTVATQFDPRIADMESAQTQIVPTVDRSKTPKHYFSVCAIFRDEGAYLAEWIAYHTLVGVDHFYLWEHQSSPSDPWQQILAPYIERGKVTLHRAPPDAMQGKTMDGCIAQYAKDNFWMAVIDIDEFLVPKQVDDVKEVLRAYEGEYGLFLSWRLFAGFPHVTAPSGLVTESYLHPISREHSQEGKLIINTRIAPVHLCKFSAREDRNATEVGLNHNCFSWSGSPVYVVDEMQRATKQDWSLAPPSYQHLQLNHYHAKSEEECMAKARRGFSWLESLLPADIEDWPPSIRDRKTGKRCQQSEQYCLRSKQETDILRYLPALKRMLRSGNVTVGEGINCDLNETEVQSQDLSEAKVLDTLLQS